MWEPSAGQRVGKGTSGKEPTGEALPCSLRRLLFLETSGGAWDTNGDVPVPPGVQREEQCRGAVQPQEVLGVLPKSSHPCGTTGEGPSPPAPNYRER